MMQSKLMTSGFGRIPKANLSWY